MRGSACEGEVDGLARCAARQRRCVAPAGALDGLAEFVEQVERFLERSSS